jgi:DNA-binding GntR family transcriptional regulator
MFEQAYPKLTTDRRLPTRALYEQVAEGLRARIASHQLAPGSWIDEQAIASELGISRTPLREALKVLAAEGLVTMKLRRGAYVTEVSPRELEEVFHLLGLLEADAAADLARRITGEQIVELTAIHAELEAATSDHDAFFAANERFHLRVLELADNRWRLQMVADLRKVMKLSRHQSLFKQGRIDASLEEHRRVLAALTSRNPERARAEMAHHIGAGRTAASLS